MNRQKQIDMIRRKNAELSKQLDDLRFKLEYDSQLNSNAVERAKNLIDDLEKIKQDWLSTLNDLNNKREKYSELITDLQKIKNIMVNRGFKIPWYKKVINRFKK